jgi:betaine-aldehyde dehydrogenase
LRVTLELGGKSTNIFSADADFEAAIDGALFGAFVNQGEVCSAGSRVLVERPIYNKFVEALTAKARTIKLEPPLARETKMGPLSAKSNTIESAHTKSLGKKEAKLATGGSRPSAPTTGYYVEPTILYDVDSSAKATREEIFGPVSSVIPFDSEPDAIRLASDSPYDLAAAVWSRDIFRALRVVKALRVGIVSGEPYAAHLR